MEVYGGSQVEPGLRTNEDPELKCQAGVLLGKC